VHQVLELIEALGPVLAAALVDLFGEVLVVVDAEGDPLGVLVLDAFVSDLHLFELLGEPGVVGDLDGGGALGGVGLEHLADETDAGLGGGVEDVRVHRELALLDLLEDVAAVVGLEGVDAVQQLVEDDAEGPDVHRGVRRRVAGDHFGREVLRRALR